MALIAMLLWQPASAQLTTSTGFTAQQLVQNVLLGPGVTASNFTFSGDPNQSGTFTCTSCNVGLTNGVILASGDIAGSAGPNNTGSMMMGGGNFGVSDPDLDMLIPPTINDAAILEFDFVPTGDSIKFNFVFASEEYLEWVGSVFEDAFGFFLSGPGIAGPYSNGAVNLAKVPGSVMTPITINTINDVTNSAYYINNGTGMNAPYNSSNFYIQYDGMTVVLMAEAEVICGQTYHIKMAIGDGSDTAWDCAVFLEAGSFASNSINLSTEILAGGVDSVLYEGCGTATVHVVRAGLATDTATATLSTAGTAVNGIDYAGVPSSLVFLPGVDSITFTVNALISPGSGMRQADILAIFDGDCGVDTAVMTFWVDDPPPINLGISNDTTVTCGDSALIVASATGGYQTLYYDWNMGVPDGSLSGYVAPLTTTTYILTVTDDCGVVTETIDVTVNIPILAPLLVTAIPDTVVFCPESPVALGSIVTGGQPGYTYQWSGGLGTGSTANVAPPNDQNWWLTVTDLCGTSTTDMVSVVVDYDTVQVVIVPDTSICQGDMITLTAVPSLGWNGYSFTWDDGSTTPTLDVAPWDTTSYSVTVTDGCVISWNDQTTVNVNQPIAAFTWYGDVYVEDFPILFTDMSSHAVTWSWDFDYPGLVSDQQNNLITWPDSGTYEVMLAISDYLGCVDTIWQSIVINPEMVFFAPSAFTPNGDGTNDVFFGTGVGIKAERMRVFDRWGEMIYESTDPMASWDGSYKGTPAQNGQYVFQFEVRAISGKVKEFTGHVQLVR